MAGKTAIQWVEDNKQALIDVSDRIWEYAEVGLQESKSAKLLEMQLEQAGFTIESGVAGMPTAFVATWGEGRPKIGYLAEYDALPHLSQKTVPYQEPLKKGAPGHGCGHNLYGAAVLGAVLGLQAEMKKDDLPGTIIFYGCPAEETLVGKVFMARDGFYDDLDLALTWHPSSFNSVSASMSNAMNSVKFKFHGRTAHAAGDPHNGRSALDAVELMNVGVNYLREHVIPQARIHYVITNGGGEPNIVPDEAQVWYYVRAPKRKYVDEIFSRVVKIAEGAAMMTETTMEMRFLTGCYDTLSNQVLNDILLESMQEIGPMKWTDQEIEFAKQMTEKFTPGQKEGSLEANGLVDKYQDKYLADDVILPINVGKRGGGSTDVGDVSWNVPTSQIGTACRVIGSAGHSWQFTATSGMSIGHKGMLLAAKTLAMTGSKLLRNQSLIEEAQAEFKLATKDHPYVCAVPNHVKPPLDQLPKQE